MDKRGKLIVILLVVIMIVEGVIIGHRSNSNDESIKVNSNTLSNTLNSQIAVETKEKQNIYELPYYELEVMDAPYVMYLNKENVLKAYPYEEAANINKVFPNYVNTLSVLKNKNHEVWALIEFIDYSYVGENAYGYVKFEDLINKEYTDYLMCEGESINGIKIGDKVEKAVTEFGREFKRIKNELFWIYQYEGLSMSFNPISYTVDSITVTSEQFKTAQNFGIGDKAIEVINVYMSLYPLIQGDDLSTNKEVFDLGKGYAIEFGYDSDTLTQASKINYISFYHIDNKVS